MTALNIGTSAIRQLDGLYSLNDLHRASGGEAKHEPHQFMRLDQTQALITEIKSADSRNCVQTQRGANGGTYACRELVIAYAAWISAAFHLKVIRVFLAQQAPSLASRRWLISFDHMNREIIQEIDWNDCLLKYEDLPRLLKAHDNMVDSDLLAAIGQACIERLRDQTHGMSGTIARLREAQSRGMNAIKSSEGV